MAPEHRNRWSPGGAAWREAIAGGRCVVPVPGDPFRPLCLSKAVAVDDARGGPVCRKHQSGSRVLRDQLRTAFINIHDSIDELGDMELGELEAFVKNWTKKR
jgi:hypothetical protein